MQAKALDDVIVSVQRRFGSQALVRAAALPAPTPWPAGDPFDRLSGIGGLPKGRLTLLSGTGSCGRLSLALRLLGRATREFAHAVVVDPAGVFDPWSLLPFDPDLKTLTLVRLQAVGEAVASLAKAGAGFILVLGRIEEELIPQVEAGAAKSGCVLVAVPDEVVDRPISHASSLTLQVERSGWLIERGLLTGLRCEVRCVKNRVAPPLGSTQMEIRYPMGPNHVLSNPLLTSPSQAGGGNVECVSAAV